MMERQIAEAEEQLRAFQDERDQLEQDMEDNQVIFCAWSIFQKMYFKGFMNKNSYLYKLDTVKYI